MKGGALQKIVGGMVLVALAIAVPAVKLYGSGDILADLSADPLLIAGCLAIAVLGVLVSASGMKLLKKIEAMTRLIETMVREKNRVTTEEIARAVGLHETEVRERVDEMIRDKTIPAGARITYIGGEKVVK